MRGSLCGSWYCLLLAQGAACVQLCGSVAMACVRFGLLLHVGLGLLYRTARCTAVTGLMCELGSCSVRVGGARHACSLSVACVRLACGLYVLLGCDVARVRLGGALSETRLVVRCMYGVPHGSVYRSDRLDALLHVRLRFM